MPRIVPLQLLKCLRVLLDNNGGILSATEVKRIAGLMTKYSKKLVSKCVYVQILKSTKTELLGDFMTVGGWGLVCTWLSDAIRTMNWPLVQEILELLLLSPVDVNRLKINSAPILVKGLCKDGGNEGVRILAKRLVEQWLKIVTENSIGTPSTNSPMGTSGESTQAQTSMTPQTKDLSGQDQKGSGAADSTLNMEISSSDSTDSGPTTTQNYTISSGENKRNLVITIKTVDKSASVNADSSYDDEGGCLPAAKAGTEFRGAVESCEKRGLDDSITAESNAGDDEADKKHKSPRDKSKRTDKEREKDRKSSGSHRSSSSSHKSSSSSSKSSSKGSSSSHRSSSDKHRDKDKSRSSSGSSSSKEKDRKEGSSTSSSNKHKSSKSPSSSLSLSSSTSSKDRSRDKDKEKSTLTLNPRKELDKDNKLMPPPLAAAATSEKKTKDVENEVPKPKSISIPSRKASISIEIRRDTEKAATVKTYQSKFRSHGLTEEAPPPPSRKGLKKPSTVTTPIVPPAIPSATVKRPSPPPRDTVPAEKRPKIDINNVSGHVERPGAAKLIAPKKIQTLVETNLFSDALAASIEPKKVVKRKRLNAAVSPTEKDAPLAPLKFYQDTLDESKSDDKSDDSTKENDESRSGSPGKDTDVDDDDIPLKKVKEDIEQKVQKEKASGDAAAEDADSAGKEDDIPEEPKKPGPGCGPNGPPGVLMLHRRKGPKKKLTWQPDEKLTQVRFFEVDRSERVNVTKQSFLEMKNMERYSERDAMNIARRGFDDIMEPQIEWRALIEVDNVPDHPNGNLSKQRVVQAEREATTLRALYFSPDMIPDSAAEAELEPHFSHDIPVIPIDDLTGNPDAVNDYSALPWPEPKGYGVPAAVSGAGGGGVGDMGFNDSINNLMPPLNPNMMPANPFQPFGNNFMPQPNPNQPLPMNMQQAGPPPIWQNPMTGSPMMNPMNGPPNGMDMNNVGGMPPQNFMGNQFGNPGPFGAPPGFNMNFPPMMMNGPGPGPGPGPNGPMMNGPMANGMGPMGPNGGPRNNNRKNVGGGGGGNWRSGGNNFQDNSGGNWRSAGSGANRGGVNNNTGICKQFMRGHCHMGKACKYVHPQKKRM